MYCKNCGNEVKNNERFCPNCGTALAEQGNVTKKIMINGVEMSVADMVEYCIENKCINIANLWANQTKKEWNFWDDCENYSVKEVKLAPSTMMP